MLLPDRRCGASLLVSPVFDRLPRIRHGFSTRSLGDASGHPAGGQALDRVLAMDHSSPEGGPRVRAPESWRLRAPESWRLRAPESWRRHGLRQVHGASVVLASAATLAQVPPEGDASWTTEPGELLVIRTADCVPLLLAALGPRGVAGIAAVHAGWRGLVAGIVPAAVATLAAALPATKLVAAMGPCIGACCFEVGPDAAEPLRGIGAPGGLRPAGGDKSIADLPAVARFQLAASGASLAPGAPPPCTRCHPELFPSFRRDREQATRMASFIGIAKA